MCLFLMGIAPNILGVPNSTLTTDINDSTSGTTLLVSGVASQNIYITHITVMAAGTVNVSLSYGTGSNCATGVTTLVGPMPLIAQTGWGPGTGLGAVYVVPAGKDLCLTTDQSVQVGGAVTTAIY